MHTKVMHIVGTKASVGDVIPVVVHGQTIDVSVQRVKKVVVDGVPVRVAECSVPESVLVAVQQEDHVSVTVDALVRVGTVEVEREVGDVVGDVVVDLRRAPVSEVNVTVG